MPTTTTLTGIQTAAIVLMNLDRAQAAQVLQSFPESEAADIGGEIARLRNVDEESTTEALTYFHKLVLGHMPPAKGGRELAQSLLEAAFGSERAAGLLSKLGSSMNGSSFDFLASSDPGQIANMIESELPPTIALVLAHLPSRTAAGVLAGLPDGVRTDVAVALAKMGAPSQEAVNIIAESLRNRHGSFAMRDGSPDNVGGVMPLVDIINRSDASIEKALLSELELVDGELAEEVRSRMFTFVDIVILDDRDVQMVLRGIDIRALAVALKGANEGVSDKIRRNMTERNREALDEEAQVIGAVRASEVEQARSEIVRIIRELEQSGEVKVHRGEDEYVS